MVFNPRLLSNGCRRLIAVDRGLPFSLITSIIYPLALENRLHMPSVFDVPACAIHADMLYLALCQDMAKAAFYLRVNLVAACSVRYFLPRSAQACLVLWKKKFW